jgi:hypothetical protein
VGGGGWWDLSYKKSLRLHLERSRYTTPKRPERWRRMSERERGYLPCTDNIPQLIRPIKLWRLFPPPLLSNPLQRRLTATRRPISLFRHALHHQTRERERELIFQPSIMPVHLSLRIASNWSDIPMPCRCDVGKRNTAFITEDDHPPSKNTLKCIYTYIARRISWHSGYRVGVVRLKKEKKKSRKCARVCGGSLCAMIESFRTSDFRNDDESTEKKKIDVGTRWRTLWKKKIPSFRGTSVGRIALRTRQRARVDTASKHKATVWKIISQGEKKKKQTIGNESWRRIRRGGNIIAPRKKKSKNNVRNAFWIPRLKKKPKQNKLYLLHTIFSSVLLLLFSLWFYSTLCDFVLTFVQTPLRVFLSSHLEIIRFSFLTQVYIPWHILRAALYSFLGPFFCFLVERTQSQLFTRIGLRYLPTLLTLFLSLAVSIMCWSSTKEQATASIVAKQRDKHGRPFGKEKQFFLY